MTQGPAKGAAEGQEVIVLDPAQIRTFWATKVTGRSGQELEHAPSLFGQIVKAEASGDLTLTPADYQPSGESGLNRPSGFVQGLLQDYPEYRRPVSDEELAAIAPARGFTAFPYIQEGIRFQIKDGIAVTAFFKISDTAKDRAKAAVEFLTDLKWEEKGDAVQLIPRAGTNPQALANQLAQFGAYALKGSMTSLSDTQTLGDTMGFAKEARIEPTVLRKTHSDHVKVRFDIVKDEAGIWTAQTAYFNEVSPKVKTAFLENVKVRGKLNFEDVQVTESRETRQLRSPILEKDGTGAGAMAIHDTVFSTETRETVTPKLSLALKPKNSLPGQPEPNDGEAIERLAKHIGRVGGRAYLHGQAISSGAAIERKA